jgi:pteridine reductase
MSQVKAKIPNAVLITGGAKRIGRHLALNLAQQGFDVAISYNKSGQEAEELAQKIRSEFGVRCEIFRADLTDKNQVKSLATEVTKTFPHWNLLINNASIFNKSKFLDSGEEELFANLNTHLIAPLLLAKEFAKHSNSEAQIINMIDKNIARFDTNYFYYLLSKKFLAEFTRMLALELAPKIRVNGIAPGFILNSIDEQDPASETARLTQKIPLKTKGDAENIWQAVEFLLNNKFVTGQILFIDGGASLNHAG